MRVAGTAAALSRSDVPRVWEVGCACRICFPCGSTLAPHSDCAGTMAYQSGTLLMLHGSCTGATLVRCSVVPFLVLRRDCAGTTQDLHWFFSGVIQCYTGAALAGTRAEVGVGVAVAAAVAVAIAIVALDSVV